MTFGLVILGPILAAATFLVLGPLDQGAAAPTLSLVLLADFIYMLLVAALVLQRVAAMIAARRAKSAGSRLHLRLTGVFVVMALLPAVLIAVFAVLTLNAGLETWFSERVRSVVGASLSAAEAYESNERLGLVQDTRALAGILNRARRATGFVTDGQLRQLLGQAQGQVQRGLRDAYVIDGTGEIRARGERSYLFDYERPVEIDLARARDGELVIIQDWDADEFRALLKLSGYLDRYLYITRGVDGDILGLLDETQATARLYQQQEQERGRRLFDFALLYLGFAALLLLAAVWLGLWFAERLSGPVGRLAGAAQRVGNGDLDVHLREESGDDEIAMLGRIFNQMTRQLKRQRDTLLKNNAQIERRRRLFDSVLSSITAGVVGLDEQGAVAFINRSAQRLLNLPADVHEGRLAKVVPEFSTLFKELRSSSDEVAQDAIRMTRRGKLEYLLVRMATRRSDDGKLEGYVIAFDDVTDLVAAQRMAAWGDVARRIAHEIKNPLTPIQLSAERLKRKYGPLVDREQTETLAQMTDVIVRQTGDLRRIVDEFSRFARMPEPERRNHDLAKLARDAVLLQEGAQSDGVTFVSDIPDCAVPANIDATMISQALTNLIKNAGEAIESYKARSGGKAYAGEIRVSMKVDKSDAIISISDNGIGLPEDRAKLFEPYVTTRENGTGLGLSIVMKIIEEHDGVLALTDADPFEPGAQRGARADIRLPLTVQEASSGHRGRKRTRKKTSEKGERVWATF